MKQNWWKLLVVLVLIVAVGAVLAGKNRDSGEKSPAVVESKAEVTSEAVVQDQPAPEADKDVKEVAESVAGTAKANDAKAVQKPETVAKADAGDKAKPVAKADSKPATEPASKTVVAAKEEPKPVVKAEQPQVAPKKLPKMIELGAEKCIPCKMMKPIIEDLQRDYKGKLDVVFIDVWKDSSAAEKYGIQSIPTQVFLDEDGKEFFRHVGFFAKEDILKTFADHGIKLN